VNFVGAPLSATIQNITITGGRAGEGGGILFDGSSGTVHGCRIIDNTATATGGGGVMVKNSSNPLFSSSTLISNGTSGIGVSGGAFYVKGGSTLRIENCALWQNSAYDATAMYSAGNGTVTTVVNSIIWDHGPGTSGNEIQSPLGAVTSITYSDVEGGYGGTGNVDTNPIFMDTDLRLAPISPCIDAGSNAGVTVSTDYDDNDRIFDGDGGGNADVDMGPFEYGSGTSVGVIDDLIPSGTLRLLPAWPNPTRAGVHLAFSLDRREHVTMVVFELRGRKVATVVDRELAEGDHYFTWDGRDELERRTPAGLYLVRMIAGEVQRTLKVMRVR
jgi:parallel beta-helix repeat protein